MPKIAFFLPTLAGGGAERVCINLAVGFLARGLEVDFVLAKASGVLLKTLPAGARVIDLSSKRTLTAVLPLAAYLRRESPYALIAAPDHVNIAAIWAKLFGRSATRIITTHHIHPSLAIRNSPKLQEKLYPFLLRTFHRWAFGQVAVSKGVADDLSRLARIPRSQISVIHNPIVSDDLQRQKAVPVDHPWFGPGMLPVILSAGRLTAQKGYPTLLKAFAVLSEQRPVKLIILGEGEESARLQAYSCELGIQADVDMPGFKENPYAYMARCHVFVLSSVWEGFGNVLVEALACGTQVVSTDCPSGPAEILDGGKYGWLVKVGDAPALANAMEAALDHPRPVEMLQARANVFSIDAAVDNYLHVLGMH